MHSMLCKMETLKSKNDKQMVVFILVKPDKIKRDSLDKSKPLPLKSNGRKRSDQMTLYTDSRSHRFPKVF